MLPAARATLDALASDPLTTALQVKLAATALLLDDLAALLQYLVQASGNPCGFVILSRSEGSLVLETEILHSACRLRSG